MFKKVLAKFLYVWKHIIEYSIKYYRKTNEVTETAQLYLEAEIYLPTCDEKDKIIKNILKWSEVFI